MEHLLLQRDGVELAAIPLGTAGLEIGSAPGNGLRLRGPDVRPFHLVLRRRRQRWWAVGRDGALRLGAGGSAGTVALEPGVAIVLGAYRVAIAGEREADARGPAPPGRERTRPLEVARPAVDGAPVLRLRYLGHDGRVQHRRLGPDPTVLGRDESCDVVLRDPSVSARHARIVAEAGAAVLEDLASLNGCWLDGRRVWAADLAAGAALRLGACEVDVLGTADPERPARRRLRPVFPPGLGPALATLRIAAGSAEPCVLLGETGSGKEVLARHLHELGARRAGPFVAVNAAALPHELAESILFGHRRGAFTGAVEPHRGAFERAHGGTLFLDEVGETPPEIQAKLLRAIEESSVMPVGAEKPVEVDVRVVAATNRDLPAVVRTGRFRLDLWHRLAVFVVHIPPLRERRGDIALLAQAILDGLVDDDPPLRLDDDAVAVLRGHPWPGNVRELRNVLVRAAALGGGRRIGAGLLRRMLDDDAIIDPSASRALDLDAVLQSHRGNVSAAARAAGLARTTFRERLAQSRGRDPAPP